MRITVSGDKIVGEAKDAGSFEDFGDPNSMPTIVVLLETSIELKINNYLMTDY